MLAVVFAVAGCSSGADDADGGGPDACTPSCDGRTCGDDGCGGVCGVCPATTPLCEAGVCETGVPAGEPGLSVAPATVDFGPVASLDVAEDVVTLVSIGDVPVTVTGFSLAGDPGFAAVVGGTLVGKSTAEGQEMDLTSPLTLAPGASRQIPVLFEAKTGADAEALLAFASDSAGVVPAETRLQAHGAVPEIDVAPTVLSFEDVAPGTTETKDLIITNPGERTLHVEGFRLSGDPGFAVVAGPTSMSPSGVVVFDEPLAVEPGGSTALDVRFAPVDPLPAFAELVLVSDAPEVTVKIRGNGGGRCLRVEPAEVDFGGRLLGKPAVVDVALTSCGDEPVEIHEIRLAEDSSTDFSLNVGGLPGVEDGQGALSADQHDPVTLAPGASATLEVTFVPDEINPLDGDAQPIPDLGTIHIVSDALPSELDVPIRGRGVEVECPTAVLVVQEGEEVSPQTKLHLVGSHSYAAVGHVAQYEWTVKQPPGSQSVFLPSASVANPTFHVNVAGIYVFELNVWDQHGEEACVSAQYTVFVNPDEAIHVELLWDTPLDPDQTDEGPEAGADLDLHFRHPLAAGADYGLNGWFDQPYDCFWFNAHPNWGSLNPSVDDDPGLDRDDTDGLGPENLNLNIPEYGLTYRIGVHYWSARGFGGSTATVRVYVHSELVFEDEALLAEHDLWEVATIDWPGGEVTPVTDPGGGRKILPGYQHPFFPSE